MYLFLFFVFLGLLLWGLWGLSGWSFFFIPYGGFYVDFTQNLCFDFLSFLCLLMLWSCGSLSLVYCFHYMSVEASSLFGLMLLFLGVMTGLVVTSSLGVTLIFWEYLGLVSFFLILYYSNSVSYRASAVTLVASRFGDVALFVVAGLVCFYGWSSLLFYLGVLLVFFIVGSKSAIFPFISWLLEAMRAPTPVSSLVHSSTLVAAGAWFLYRYGGEFSACSYGVLFSFSVFTIFLSALCALVFKDMKKIVALSTCNNVSWCLVYYLCGGITLALIQLFSHGVSKCYLFMSVGDLMSGSWSGQDLSGVYRCGYQGLWGSVSVSFLVLSLCGLPFLGVFYSKHLMLAGSFVGAGCFYTFFLFFGVFLSYAYSFRLVFMILLSPGGISHGLISVFYPLSVFVFLGTLINFFWVGGSLEGSSFSGVGSILYFFLQSAGVVFGYLFFFFGSRRLIHSWSSFLGGGDAFVMWIYRLFSEISLCFCLAGYRWEFALFSRSGHALKGLTYFLFSLGSLNGLVLGLFFVSFLSVLNCWPGVWAW